MTTNHQMNDYCRLFIKSIERLNFDKESEEGRMLLNLKSLNEHYLAHRDKEETLCGNCGNVINSLQCDACQEKSKLIVE